MFGVWMWRSAVSTGRGRRQGAIGDGGVAPGGSDGDRGAGDAGTDHGEIEHGTIGHAGGQWKRGMWPFSHPHRWGSINIGRSSDSTIAMNPFHRIPGRRFLHAPGPTHVPDEVVHAMSRWTWPIPGWTR